MEFTFCSEQQMEVHFAKWKRGKVADPEKLAASVVSRIHSNIKSLSHKIARRESVTELVKFLRSEALESVLFAQFVTETGATKQPHGAGWSMYLPAA